MDHFTAEEIKLIAKNAKDVIDYIKTELAPKLRTEMNFSYFVEDSTPELHLAIYPDLPDPIHLYRVNTYNLTTLDESTTYTDFYFAGNKKIQFILLKNWPETKVKIITQIEKDKEDINFLKNFTV
jgi:hypothetical protein